MKTVVIIWLACGQSNGKSGTDSGTDSRSIQKGNSESFPQARVIVQIPENHPALIPPSLSRTPVPNFDRGNRCLYWMSRSPEDCTDRQRFCTRTGNTPPSLARQARFRAGIGTEDHGSAERGESPQKPASRLVAGQGRRRFDGERREGQMEEKQRFFSPIPAGFRRIYFEAGIKTGVGFAPAPFTSTRNGGLFWAFVKPPGRNLRRGRFGFVSPRFVLSPFLPIQGGNA